MQCNKPQSANQHSKLLRKTIQKAVEATGNSIGSKIANKITKNSPQNTSKTLCFRVKQKFQKKDVHLQ